MLVGSLGCYGAEKVTYQKVTIDRSPFRTSMFPRKIHNIWFLAAKCFFAIYEESVNRLSVNIPNEATFRQYSFLKAQSYVISIFAVLSDKTSRFVLQNIMFRLTKSRLASICVEIHFFPDSFLISAYEISRFLKFENLKCGKCARKYCPLGHQTDKNEMMSFCQTKSRGQIPRSVSTQQKKESFDI